MRHSRSFEITLVMFVSLFRVYLFGEVGKMFVFSHVLEYELVVGIKRYFSPDACLSLANKRTQKDFLPQPPVRPIMYV